MYSGSYNSGHPQVDAITSVDGQWITLHHERILWLPSEYRPGLSPIRGGMVIVGKTSGLVCDGVLLQAEITIGRIKRHLCGAGKIQ